MDNARQPLLTALLCQQLSEARRDGLATVECSLDLELSRTSVDIGPTHWSWHGRQYPYPTGCKERTIYYWDGEVFEAAARYCESLVKLVPTCWGAPTFEIDGIKMLPTAHISPFADAFNKVRLIEPEGKRILDTCGGIGYFAAGCQMLKAVAVVSFEKNADVIWLRSINPWSPVDDSRVSLTNADIAQTIGGLPDASVDAALHDPPRFSIAGDLYSQGFYDQLARVLKRGAKLFHYTGSPNKFSAGRDLGIEVANRLRKAGFTAEKYGDGVMAIRANRSKSYSW